MHEIGHALGFWHEQQRPDRDDVITILWDHLNYYKSQYMKRPVLDDFELQYDIDSVMHYGPKVDGRVCETRAETSKHLLEGHIKAKILMYAISSDTHQLQFMKLHHFKLERFKLI